MFLLLIFLFNQALGNHEFDFGLKGLLPFLRNINFPIAVANLNISTDHPLWQTHALEKSVVFNIKGTKVGVIGYILPEVITMSKTEDVEVSPEIGAIKYVLYILFINVEALNCAQDQDFFVLLN